MGNNKDRVRCRSPPEGKERGFGLEDILKRKVTLDTDIMEFLLIAGWNTWGSSIYRNATVGLSQKLREYVNEKREGLSMGEKMMERRFVHAIISAGYSKGEPKTLRDLKIEIEKEGLSRLRGIHYKTLAHLNETFKKYRIEPIKVGGRYITAKTLKKYGLEPAKKVSLYTGLN